MLAVTNEFITSLNSRFGLYVQKLDKGQHRIINSTSVSGVIIHVTHARNLTSCMPHKSEGRGKGSSESLK